MLFDDHDVSGNRLFGLKKRKNRKSITGDRVVLGAKLRGGTQKTAVIVLIPMLLIALGVLVWFGVVSLGNALFFENERFDIVSVEVKGCRVMTPEKVKQLTGIREGMNIFSLSNSTNSIRKIRRDFLEGQHSVKYFEISRLLPGTVKITLEERTPTAVIGFKGDKVVDIEGHVFAYKPGMPDLPYISEYRGPTLQPGGRIQRGMMMAAIQALEFCDDPRLGFRIESVGVGNQDRIDLRVRYEGESKEVRIAWKDMDKGTPESRQCFSDKLGRVIKTMGTEAGRRTPAFDCMLDDTIRLLPK